MLSRGTRIFLAAVIVLVLVTGAFSGGLVVGWLLPNPRASAVFAPTQPGQSQQVEPQGTEASGSQGSNSNAATDLNQLFKPFWEAWQIVHENYVDQPLDDTALMRGAIKGMVEALGDPHTSYMDPDQYRQLNMSLEGEYDGIGAWVDTDAEYLTIVSPMPGSPAEKAGLQPGDQVIAINGEDMTGIDGNLAIRRVLGPAGSSVTLTILRKDNPEPFDVVVERAHITVPSVESKMLDNNIGYIALFDFGANTTDELRAALKSILDQNPKGLVIDLRNNPGGYLNTAVEVASEFIDSGTVLLEETGDGQRKTYEALGHGMATQVPLVVLVNEGSASASEILAGAIQDHGRGKLVGATTYGKGSVQMPIELKDGQGLVRVTIARWLTPDGRQINGVGLKPDVEVQMTSEDYTAKRDPQLDKAIEVLLQNLQ